MPRLLTWLAGQGPLSHFLKKSLLKIHSKGFAKCLIKNTQQRFIGPVACKFSVKDATSFNLLGGWPSPIFFKEKT